MSTFTIWELNLHTQAADFCILEVHSENQPGTGHPRQQERSIDFDSTMSARHSPNVASRVTTWACGDAVHLLSQLGRADVQGNFAQTAARVNRQTCGVAHQQVVYSTPRLARIVTVHTVRMKDRVKKSLLHCIIRRSAISIERTTLLTPYWSAMPAIADAYNLISELELSARRRPSKFSREGPSCRNSCRSRHAITAHTFGHNLPFPDDQRRATIAA